MYNRAMLENAARHRRRGYAENMPGPHRLHPKHIQAGHDGKGKEENSAGKTDEEVPTNESEVPRGNRRMRWRKEVPLNTYNRGIAANTVCGATYRQRGYRTGVRTKEDLGKNWRAHIDCITP